jgi:predicted nucleotide-binding protein
MPAKRSAEPLSEPNLDMHRSQAATAITDRIEKGKELAARSIASDDEHDGVQRDYYRWNSYNEDMLARMFDNRKVANEYRGIVIGGGGEGRLPEKIASLRKDINYKIHVLETILDRLPLIPEPSNAAAPSTASEKTAPASKKMFIIHGHDEAAKSTVARFLEKLDLEAIILSECISKGDTIIEKFERNTEDIGFAVVLLTPDDSGFSKAKPAEPELRARQNVILELGYFLGKLGRDKVCALRKGDTVAPSDFHGVVYVPMDDAGGWQLTLAREIDGADIPIDFNKVFR